MTDEHELTDDFGANRSLSQTLETTPYVPL